MRHLHKKMLRIVYMMLAAVLLLQPVMATETDDWGEFRVETTETGGESYNYGVRAAMISEEPVPTYTIGQAGLDLIKYYEGFRAEKYWDNSRYSIGYGGSYEKALAKYPELATTGKLTEEQAEALLADELQEDGGVEDKVNRYITNNSIVFNQNQFDAVVSFTYNVGVRWMYDTNSDGTPYRIRALLEGIPANWTLENCKSAFGTWVKAGGVTLQGLVTRRNAESELFCTPWEEPDEPEQPEAPEEPEENDPLFDDVAEDIWYAQFVQDAYDMELMQGDGNGLFRPEDNMKRAEMVKALANLDRADLSGYSAPDFTDVAEDAWYAPAVAWAVDYEVVNGKGDGTFGPEESIRREHVCNIIARYLKAQGVPAGDISMTFTDEADMETTSVENVYYCVSLGIIDGMGNGTFAPRESATRAQIAKILVKTAQALAD